MTGVLPIGCRVERWGTVQVQYRCNRIVFWKNWEIECAALHWRVIIQIRAGSMRCGTVVTAVGLVFFYRGPFVYYVNDSNEILPFPREDKFLGIWGVAGFSSAAQHRRVESMCSSTRLQLIRDIVVREVPVRYGTGTASYGTVVMFAARNGLGGGLRVEDGDWCGIKEYNLIRKIII